MTRNELVNRYLSYLSGSAGVHYKGDSAEPVLPFLLMDIAYQEYMHQVAPIKLRHELKLMDDNWRKNYNMFNRSLFGVFKPEEKAEVTDLMDELAESLNNDITMLRSKIMLIIEDVSFEDRMVIAALLICNMMAQFAQHAWGNVFKTETITAVGSRKEPNRNRYLQNIEGISFKMAQRYFASLSDGNIYLRQLKVDGIFDTIASHIYKWIRG